MLLDNRTVALLMLRQNLFRGLLGELLKLVVDHTAGPHSCVPLHDLKLGLLALCHHSSPLILLRIVVIVQFLGHWAGFWERASICTELLRMLWALLG